MENQIISESITGQNDFESIKVLIRVRPLSENETRSGEEEVVNIFSETSLTIPSSDGKRSFQCNFDHVLGPSTSQNEVYDILKSCTASVLDGFNSTIFAYGQTGSGKTFSMYGPPAHLRANTGGSRDLEGVIPRAVRDIFALSGRPEIIDFQAHCSFVQIYNENLYDMLRDARMQIPLTIREENKEIYVQGLSEYNVKSTGDVLQLLNIAEENRAMRETHMNMFSSRSHSIFQLFIEHKRLADDGGEISYRSKFNLVDLAGSEKWNVHQQMLNEHIAEMTNINLSLHTLGKCISALAQKSRKRQKKRKNQQKTTTGNNHRYNSNNNLTENNYLSDDNLSVTEQSWANLEDSMELTGEESVDFNRSRKQQRGIALESSQESIINPTQPQNKYHVPYRESKLTRLLQDSLGGNARTFLIATVSPASCNCEESISTLKFADRAKQVMVMAVTNESRPVDFALVQRLQNEVKHLRSLLQKFIQISNLNPYTRGDPLFQETIQNTVQTLGSSFGAPQKLLEQSQPSVPVELQDMGVKHSVEEGFKMNLKMTSVATSPVKGLNARDGEGFGVGDMRKEREESTTLQVVMGLEEALNKEQIHSQHLMKKNETLIKELEALKIEKMENDRNNEKLKGFEAAYGENSGFNQFNNGVVESKSDAKVEFNDLKKNNQKIVSLDSMILAPDESKGLIVSFKSLLQQHSYLWEQQESIQKVLRKFFKFQIEEEDMKNQVNQIFEKLKEVKESGTDEGNIILQSQEKISFLEYLQRQQQQQIFQTQIQKSLNSKEKASPTHFPLNKMHKSKSADYAPSNYESPPKTKSKNFNSENRDSPAKQSSPHLIQTQIRQLSRGSDWGSPDGSNSKSNSIGQSGAIPFRVRGGTSQQLQGLSQGSVGSQGSGWVLPPLEDDQEEERLKQELKKTKKKLRHQQQVKEWLRQKEERINMETRIQAEERKAMKEAEIQRENKRKEHAQKQKQKIQSYQNKIKLEAEKIQELKDLGIDPSSLFH